MPLRTREEMAREYIDSIVEINRKYGMAMDGDHSEDAYREAVAAAAGAYRCERKGAVSPGARRAASSSTGR